MKHTIRLISLLVLFICYSWQGHASHVIGGDITWKCQGDGTYIFYLTLYRDCASNVAVPPPTIQVWNHPSVSNIPITLQSITDVSPLCNFGTPLTCASANSSTQGTIEKNVFASNPVTLTGTPPAQGWIFTYYTCCRSGNIINLISPQNEGITIRAKMFDNGSSSPCNDSSPQFSDVPFFIGCTGIPITGYNHATDPDCDSVSYNWAPTLDALDNQPFVEGVWPNVLPMDTGYTFDSPFPGPTINPNNVAVTLDSTTSAISLLSNNIGVCAYVMKVSSWRNGVLMSEVYRDMSFVFVTCGAINPEMEIEPPFYDTISQVWVYNDTVWAGEMVDINISANALGNLSSGNQPTVTLNAMGDEFGANFTDSLSGCPHLPCAILDMPTPLAAIGNVQTNFRWQTSINHVLTGMVGQAYQKTYTFIFSVDNGVCPVPRYEYKEVNITVKLDAAGVLPPPLVDCAFLQSLNSTEDIITLHWQEVDDTMGIFNGYIIYHSLSPNGPFTAIDTIYDINQTTYTDTVLAVQQHYYYVSTSFTYNSVEVESNPSSILMQVEGMMIANLLNDSGLVHFTAVPGGQGEACEWDFGDGSTGTGCDVNHLYDAGGTYTVTLYIDNECGSDTITQSVIVNYVSVEELNSGFSFELYPNPTKGELFVKFILAQEGAVELRVLDILGREEQVIPTMKGYKEMSLGIDVSNLPAGIHLLEMRVNGQRSVAKFVKE